MVRAFAVIDGSGRCINRVIWDGVSDWQPPEGCTAVPDNEGLYLLETQRPVVAAVTEELAANQTQTSASTEEAILDEADPS